MNSQRTPIFIANWKMNKSLKDVKAFAPAFNQALSGFSKSFEVVLAPPAIYLGALTDTLSGTALKASAQNCGTAKSGAFTGEISPVMLKDFGVQWVILGHSERRHVYKEDDALVLARLKAALAEGLNVVLCVGEKIEERKSNQTFQVIEKQLSILKEVPQADYGKILIAYEPVWAIGTGENATPEQAQEVHAFIRKWVSEKCNTAFAASVRVLYGGSVKPENSGQIMVKPDVDGLLVGGASLEPASFAGVVRNGLT